MSVAVVLALIAALSYGVSDFVGGVAARRMRVLPTSLLIYAAAVPTVGLALLIAGGAWSARAVLFGGIAGILAVIGLVAFYAALSIGPISLASPLIAVLGSAVPVMVALALGHRLSIVMWLAIALAIVSAGLIAVPRASDHHRLSARVVIISIVSGTALGSSVVTLNAAPSDSAVVPAVMEILVGLAFLACARVLLPRAAALRLGRLLDSEPGTSSLPARRARWLAVVAGILLGFTNAVLVLALRAGELATVSVIVGLYPLGTILLARLVLRERLSGLQIAGVVSALVATAALSVA